MAAATGRIKRLKRIDRARRRRHHARRHRRSWSASSASWSSSAPRRCRCFARASGTLLAAASRLAATAAPSVTRWRRSASTSRAAIVYSVEPTAQVAFFAADTGARVAEIAGAGARRRDGHRVVAIARRSDFVALGTSDGRVALRRRCGSRRCTTDGARARRHGRSSRIGGHGAIDAARRPVRRVAYLEEGERKFVAAQMSPIATSRSGGPTSGGAARQDVVRRRRRRSACTAVAVGRTGTAIAGTDGGEVYHWELGEQRDAHRHRRTVSAAPITALGYVIGDHSFIAGTAKATSAPGSARRSGDGRFAELVRASTSSRRRPPITAVRRLDARPHVCDGRRRRRRRAAPSDVGAHAAHAAGHGRGQPRSS